MWGQASLWFAMCGRMAEHRSAVSSWKRQECVENNSQEGGDRQSCLSDALKMLSLPNQEGHLHRFSSEGGQGWVDPGFLFFCQAHVSKARQ